jgi:hypothetical protein
VKQEAGSRMLERRRHILAHTRAEQVGKACCSRRSQSGGEDSRKAPKGGARARAVGGGARVHGRAACGDEGSHESSPSGTKRTVAGCPCSRGEDRVEGRDQ